MQRNMDNKTKALPGVPAGLRGCPETDRERRTGKKGCV